MIRTNDNEVEVGFADGERVPLVQSDDEKIVSRYMAAFGKTEAVAIAEAAWWDEQRELETRPITSSKLLDYIQQEEMRVLGFIVRHARPKFAAECICLAKNYRFLVNAANFKELAEHYTTSGMSRAHVSETVITIQRTFGNSIEGLPLTAGQRSIASRSIFRAARNKILK